MSCSSPRQPARQPRPHLLMILAMSIGVAAVVVLTGLGEGARRYVHQPVFLAGHQPA